MSRGLSKFAAVLSMLLFVLLVPPPNIAEATHGCPGVIPNVVCDAPEAALNSAVSGINSVIDGITGTVNNISSFLTDFAKNLVTGLAGLISSIVDNIITPILGKVIGWVVDKVITPIMQAFVNAAASILQLAIDENSKIFADGSTARQGFAVALNIANYGFIIGIIVIGFATILSGTSVSFKNYAWDHTLVRLIVAAVLINFGLFIVETLVVLSNRLTSVFLTDLDIGASFNADAVKNVVGTGIFGSLEGLATTLAQPLFVIGFSLILIFALLAVAFMFVLRYVWITILVVAMPFAAIVWIFPKLGFGGHNFDKWFSELTKWLIFGPVAMFFVWLAVAADKNTLIEMVIAIVLLIVGLFSAQNLGVSGGAKSAAMAKGAAVRLGKYAAGKPAVGAMKWMQQRIQPKRPTLQAAIPIAPGPSGRGPTQTTLAAFGLGAPRGVGIAGRPLVVGTGPAASAAAGAATVGVVGATGSPKAPQAAPKPIQTTLGGAPVGAAQTTGRGVGIGGRPLVSGGPAPKTPETPKSPETSKSTEKKDDRRAWAKYLDKKEADGGFKRALKAAGRGGVAYTKYSTGLDPTKKLPSMKKIREGAAEGLGKLIEETTKDGGIFGGYDKGLLGAMISGATHDAGIFKKNKAEKFKAKAKKAQEVVKKMDEEISKLADSLNIKELDGEGRLDEGKIKKRLEAVKEERDLTVDEIQLYQLVTLKPKVIEKGKDFEVKAELEKRGLGDLEGEHGHKEHKKDDHGGKKDDKKGGGSHTGRDNHAGH